MSEKIGDVDGVVSAIESQNGVGVAGEMVQWLRALTALPKVLSSNPSNHMVAHNSFGVSEDPYSVLTYNNK